MQRLKLHTLPRGTVIRFVGKAGKPGDEYKVLRRLPQLKCGGGFKTVRTKIEHVKTGVVCVASHNRSKVVYVSNSEDEANELV